jgi:hypothetical protein
MRELPYGKHSQSLSQVSEAADRINVVEHRSHTAITHCLRGGALLTGVSRLLKPERVHPITPWYLLNRFGKRQNPESDR